MSTVKFEAVLLISVVFIKVKEMVSSKLRALNSFLLLRFWVWSEKLVIGHSGALPLITFFKRLSLLILNIWSIGSHLSLTLLEGCILATRLGCIIYFQVIGTHKVCSLTIGYFSWTLLKSSLILAIGTLSTRTGEEDDALLEVKSRISIAVRMRIGCIIPSCPRLRREVRSFDVVHRT